MGIKTTRIKNLKNLLKRVNLKSFFMLSPKLAGLAIEDVKRVMVYQKWGTQKLEVQVLQERADSKNGRLKAIYYDMTEFEAIDVIIKEYAEQIKSEYKTEVENYYIRGEMQNEY